MTDIYNRMQSDIEEALALLGDLPTPEAVPTRPTLTVLKGGKA